MRISKNVSRVLTGLLILFCLSFGFSFYMYVDIAKRQQRVSQGVDMNDSYKEPKIDWFYLRAVDPLGFYK